MTPFEPRLAPEPEPADRPPAIELSGPGLSRTEDSTGELPNMGQLDEVSAELDDIDAVLARMDARAPVTVDGADENLAQHRP